MELTQLRYFYAAAKHEHITKAAAELHIAQPALTNAIHRLEAELGVDLFIRSGRSVFLSRCGEELVRRLTPILTVLDSLQEELQEIKSEDMRTVRLRLLSGAAITAKFVGAYKMRRQSIKFQLHQDVNRTVDIEITSRIYQGDDLAPFFLDENTYVFRENILLAVAWKSKFASLESVDLCNVKDEEFVCLSQQKIFRVVCDEFCRQVNFTPTIAFESDNDSAIMGLVIAGGYLSFWPQHSWEIFDAGRAKLIPISNPKCRREIIVTYNTESPRQSAARNFFDYMTGCLDTLYRNSAGK